MGSSHPYPKQSIYEPAYPLLTLPQEILLEILSFLPKSCLIKVSLVNKQFHTLCWEHRFWTCTLIKFKNKNGPSKRVCHIAEIYQDNIYVHGGHLSDNYSHYIDKVYDELYQYNIKEEKWTLLKELPIGRTEHSSIIYNDKLYIIAGYCKGGYNTNMFYYDLKNGEYKDIVYSNTSLTPNQRSAQTVVEYDGNFYMFGGWNGNVTNNEFLEYNVEENCWRNVKYTGPLPSERRSHCVAKVNDKMYIWGGYGGSSNCKPHMHIFDLKTHHWEKVKGKGKAPEPRSRAKMIYFNGKLMLMGGWDRENHFRDWYEYDLKTNEWEKVEKKFPFKEGYAQYSMVANENTIFIFGGHDSGSKSGASNKFWGYMYGSPKKNRKIMAKKPFF